MKSDDFSLKNIDKKTAENISADYPVEWNMDKIFNASYRKFLESEKADNTQETHKDEVVEDFPVEVIHKKNRIFSFGGFSAVACLALIIFTFKGLLSMPDNINDPDDVNQIPVITQTSTSTETSQTTKKSSLTTTHTTTKAATTTQNTATQTTTESAFIDIITTSIENTTSIITTQNTESTATTTTTILPETTITTITKISTPPAVISEALAGYENVTVENLFQIYNYNDNIVNKYFYNPENPNIIRRFAFTPANFTITFANNISNKSLDKISDIIENEYHEDFEVINNFSNNYRTIYIRCKKDDMRPEITNIYDIVNSIKNEVGEISSCEYIKATFYVCNSYLNNISDYRLASPRSIEAIRKYVEENEPDFYVESETVYNENHLRYYRCNVIPNDYVSAKEYLEYADRIRGYFKDSKAEYPDIYNVTNITLEEYDVVCSIYNSHELIN